MPLLCLASVLVSPAPARAQISSYTDENPADSEGVWANDCTRIPGPSDSHAHQFLYVFAGHLYYCPGNGTRSVAGRWHDNAFWVIRDRNPEMAIAKIVSPEKSS